MGSKASRDCSYDVLIAVEVATVVGEALTCVRKVHGGTRALTRTSISARAERQRLMLEEELSNDLTGVWLYFYDALLSIVTGELDDRPPDEPRYAERFIVDLQSTIETADWTRESVAMLRLEMDLASQVLLIVQQMFLLARSQQRPQQDERDERDTLMSSLRSSFQSARQRFKLVEHEIEPVHFEGIRFILCHLYGEDLFGTPSATLKSLEFCGGQDDHHHHHHHHRHTPRTDSPPEVRASETLQTATTTTTTTTYGSIGLTDRSPLVSNVVVPIRRVQHVSSEGKLLEPSRPATSDGRRRKKKKSSSAGESGGDGVRGAGQEGAEEEEEETRVGASSTRGTLKVPSAWTE